MVSGTATPTSREKSTRYGLHVSLADYLLDLGCLKDTILNLSRSALQRHGISQLPTGEVAEKRKRFKTYEIGYVHIDSWELRHADGKLVMFLAIDRVSKFIYVEFHDCAGKMEGAAFLRNVVAHPTGSISC